MQLLLISNSTNYGEAYLGWPRPHLGNFLQKNSIKRVLFVPYAGVGLHAEGLKKSFDVYEEKVASVFHELGCEIYSIHNESDPVEEVEKAEAVAVGGGNTFHLVYMMHKTGIMEAIRKRALAGMPYMGWSAGSNVACPTLCTTNDMPITEPESFKCLNLIPFQINPHYLDANPEGHGGETREQRIDEYAKVNREMYVAGLREGCLFKVEGDKLILEGERPLRVFKYGNEPKEYQKSDDISFLMED
ncbi:MAG: dipeptidase PepE [Bacteroidales bacterium]|nr:dipeptidase PepE [Bacteroidales bacterium]